MGGCELMARRRSSRAVLTEDIQYTLHSIQPRTFGSPLYARIVHHQHIDWYCNNRWCWSVIRLFNDAMISYLHLPFCNGGGYIEILISLAARFCNLCSLTKQQLQPTYLEQLNADTHSICCDGVLRLSRALDACSSQIADRMHGADGKKIVVMIQQ